jgi:predicted alpha/beta superfamily hydrolase
MTPPDLESKQHPLSAILPDTEYFEIDSKIAGARYGVWVNTPYGYAAQRERRYPAIFTPDANLVAPMLMPFSGQLSADPIHPILPFVQVSVGYCGAEVADWVWKHRNRDLLPPGEPPSPSHLAAVDAGIAAGGETAEHLKAFRAAIVNGGRADLFLRFLTEELYPRIVARWRIDTATSGLWGDSYGGLFAAWIAMQRHPLFPRIGAGSPGLMTPQSKVFELLSKEIASGADHSGRQLHFSVCGPEITIPGPYQNLGATFAQFTYLQGATPLKGLKFSSAIIPNESHLTGAPSNWFSFLRACYSAR